MPNIEPNDPRLGQIRSVLQRYVPQTAVERLTMYIARRGVHLRITRQRTSKYGDYRCPRPGQNYHAISINGDLTKPFFLLVMLHEMGHLENWCVNGTKVQPHGLEWQQFYREKILEYKNCFPADTLPLVDDYVSRLPLSAAAGRRLDTALREYGRPPAETLGVTHLNDLAPGTLFALKVKPKTVFRAIEKRRTRWLCLNLATAQRFSVSGDAEVIVINEERPQ